MVTALFKTGLHVIVLFVCCVFLNAFVISFRLALLVLLLVSVLLFSCFFILILFVFLTARS